MGADPKRTTNKNARNTRSTPAQVPVPDAGYSTFTRPASNKSCSCMDLAGLIEEIAGLDDDGYLRSYPGNDSKSWYLTYNWTNGTHKGYYVMVVCFRGELAEGYRILRDKVASVRDGTRTPRKNKYAQ